MPFSPDGKWLAVAISNGTNRPKSSPFRAEQGRLLLYSVQGTKLTRVAEAPMGRNTQGVTFTPDGQYVYVQNYVEQELAVFRGARGHGHADQGQGPPGLDPDRAPVKARAGTTASSRGRLYSPSEPAGKRAQERSGALGTGEG